MTTAQSAPHQHMRTVWWQTANPAPLTQPLCATSKVDVAIIGAGFTGLTAALHLARRGARVAVIEAETIGSGASGLNAGFVVPNFAKADPAAVIAKLGTERGHRLLQMIGGGADRVYATIRENGIACDAEQVGWMHVAHSEKMLGILERRSQAWQALGRPVRMLDAAEARRRASLRHNAGALIDESGGTLHPLNYAYGLAHAAIKAGASIHEHAPVRAVERSGNGWRLTSGKGTISADTVLLCTNASEQGAARRLGRIAVPLRVYQIATTPLDEATVRRISPDRNPVADTRANLFTFRLDRDNRLISGGMSMLPLGAEPRMAAMIAGRLQAELGLQRLPVVESIWRGTAAMTTDFLPHIYEFGPRFIGGIGCNGRGIALTAMLGEVLADAASDTPLDALPIPQASPRALPFRSFAAAAPSVAIAQARWQDRRQGL